MRGIAMSVADVRIGTSVQSSQAREGASPPFAGLRLSVISASPAFAGFASAGAAGLAKTSRPDGSCILRHCAGVTPMWLLKARWKAASDWYPTASATAPVESEDFLN